VDAGAIPYVSNIEFSRAPGPLSAESTRRKLDLSDH
jgi:hypothetical protein